MNTTTPTSASKSKKDMIQSFLIGCKLSLNALFYVHRAMYRDVNNNEQGVYSELILKGYDSYKEISSNKMSVDECASMLSFMQHIFDNLETGAYGGYDSILSTDIKYLDCKEFSKFFEGADIQEFIKNYKFLELFGYCLHKLQSVDDKLLSKFTKYFKSALKRESKARTVLLYQYGHAMRILNAENSRRERERKLVLLLTPLSKKEYERAIVPSKQKFRECIDKAFSDLRSYKTHKNKSRFPKRVKS